MRCENCEGKFTALETAIEETSPEVDVGTFAEDGTSIDSLTCTVHVSRNCEGCCTEMKSTDFEVEVSDVAIVGEPITEEQREEVTAECEVDVSESGGGRYKKNMIGFSGTITVSLGERVLATVVIEDSTPASSFEEC